MASLRVLGSIGKSFWVTWPVPIALMVSAGAGRLPGARSGLMMMVARALATAWVVAQIASIMVVVLARSSDVVVVLLEKDWVIRATHWLYQGRTDVRSTNSKDALYQPFYTTFAYIY